jgi:uncharacterized SAM-binding protein YcdF (DUF218 family)
MTVIILLGAQNDEQGRLSPMALARAGGALDAYRTQPHPRLLVTGGFGAFNRAPQAHAHYMAEFLLQNGVARQDLLPYALSAHSVDDASMTKEILSHLPIHDIHVVTSEFHVDRIRLIFTHFFDPARMSYAGTPNAVDDGTLRRLELHEQTAMKAIRRQGGILVDGFLIPTPTALTVEEERK